MSATPPDGIDRLTPQAAWEDGYRMGRESLALAYEHDKHVREMAEGRTVERLGKLEADCRRLQDEQQDAAALVASLTRRIEALEGRNQ